jgi:hypothetical protein
METVLCLREHVDIPADYEYMWSWLAKSWGMPRAAAYFPPHAAAAAADPVLTVDALTRMTTFWHNYVQHTHQEFPDSGRGGLWVIVSSQYQHTVRLANYEHLTLSIGQWPVSIIKVNMMAMASKYPYVAADLQAAGLTAQQEEAYQVALARAVFTQQAGELADSLPATSVLARNVSFTDLHTQEVTALQGAGALGSNPLVPPDYGP